MKNPTKEERRGFKSSHPSAGDRQIIARPPESCKSKPRATKRESRLEGCSGTEQKGFIPLRHLLALGEAIHRSAEGTGRAAVPQAQQCPGGCAETRAKRPGSRQLCPALSGELRTAPPAPPSQLKSAPSDPTAAPRGDHRVYFGPRATKGLWSCPASDLCARAGARRRLGAGSRQDLLQSPPLCLLSRDMSEPEGENRF